MLDLRGRAAVCLGAVVLGVLVLFVAPGPDGKRTVRTGGKALGQQSLTTDAAGAAAEAASAAPQAGAVGQAVDSATAAARPSASGVQTRTTPTSAAASVTGPTLVPRNVAKIGRGITATTVRVGIFVADFAGLQNVKGFNTGNPEVQAKAVADRINANGGIAGRRVELSFGRMPATSGNWEADEQAICSSFTEDKKVFAVIYALVSQGKTFQTCLARADTPLISSSGGPADQDVMAKNPNHLFYVGSLNTSRLAGAYIDGLVAQQFFPAGEKIGLVRPNDETYRRATEQVLKPRLAANGLKLAEEAIVNAQTSLTATAGEMSSVVLRFQGAGVRRVIFLDNATLAPLFAIQASGQGYYPKYGFNSLSNPNFFVANVPPAALAGAKGVGWISALDVDKQREGVVNASAKTCYSIMEKAGETGVDRSGVLTQRNYCDGLFFLKATLDRASELTPAGVRSIVDAGGGGFESAQTFTTRFGPNRHEAAATAKYFAFDDACRCFRYTGGSRSIP
jgi:hypothetical protein